MTKIKCCCIICLSIRGLLDMNENDNKLTFLLKKLQQGDKSVFSAVEQDFSPLINSLIAKYAQGTDELEIMQEARLALYNAAMSYDLTQKKVSFGLYAKICISNALISDARKRSKNKGQVFSLDEIEECGSYSTYFPEENYDLSKHLIDNEDAEYLYKKAVLVLSPYEAKVFELYIKGFTTSQIAQTLDKTEKSVSNALYRMKVKIRGLLKT